VRPKYFSHNGRAEEFLSKYYGSPYAQHVREGLRRALSERIARNRASKEEHELHEKLEQEQPLME
jgi:hypothetical protein